ncbi:MAG TPA: tRNA (adenosine(37)-N6)-threonylcarbamoyltransferase complex dimerization subunit type 1 TsaB [Spirochaetia bacterium]|nr:tRNA (adenosine(37)-N6)-threonylcarbamoyltransferase complex dimerization subunit type 1 TsaB [Spirochaetia bacterium]
MRIAAFDTASDLLSIALDDDGKRYVLSINIGLRHSESLLPALDSLFSLAGGTHHLDLVVCMKGPGSFTGLRIGMATAKGLASGFDCPLVVVPTLDALAFGRAFFPGAVVPVLDAKKGRVYAAIYASGRKESDDLDIAPADLVGLLAKRTPVLFTGSGADLLKPHLERREDWGIDDVRPNAAEALIELGRKRFAEYGGEPDDGGPVYLRPSEARLGG